MNTLLNNKALSIATILLKKAFVVAILSQKTLHWHKAISK